VLFNLADPASDLVAHKLDLHRLEVDAHRFAQRDQRVDFLDLVDVVVCVGEILRETLEAVLQIDSLGEWEEVGLDLAQRD
jgi:hypothetical protein